MTQKKHLNSSLFMPSKEICCQKPVRQLQRKTVGNNEEQTAHVKAMVNTSSTWKTKRTHVSPGCSGLFTSLQTQNTIIQGGLFTACMHELFAIHKLKICVFVAPRLGQVPSIIQQRGVEETVGVGQDIVCVHAWQKTAGKRKWNSLIKTQTCLGMT